MPFATIKAFQLPLLAVAKILHRNKIDVTVIHCQQAMRQGCTGMHAHNLGLNSSTKEKNDFCDKCYNASKSASKLYPWETRWLKKENKSQKKPEKFFTLSNNKLRKISGYEIFLNQKTHNSLQNKAKQAWDYKTKVLHKLLPQFWNILNEKKYDFVISYNTLYGINNLFTFLAQKLGIVPFCLHEGYHSQRPDQFILQKNNMVDNLKEINAQLRKNLKSSKINFKNIKLHVEGIIKNTRPWHYSKPFESKFDKKIEKDKSKVLVTLSSNDEVYSARIIGFYHTNNGIFSDQITWLRWVVKLAGKYPNTEFHIRPHPRIYPEKRSPVLSPFAATLEKIRKKIKAKNVHWPENDQQGSVWAHVKDTTLVLNGWSSVADVFGFLGIPVICFFPNYSPNHGYSEITAKNLNEYETKIKNILQSRKRTPNKTVLSWLSLLLSYNTFEIKWETPLWIKYIRMVWPKNMRDKFDLVKFTKYAKIFADDSKIFKIIRSQVRKKNLLKSF